MNPGVRYWLFQIPGLLLVGGVLVSLAYFDWIEWATAAMIFGLWLIKDAILFPYLKDSYRVEKKQGAQALVGREGVLESEVNPRGWIRLGGELWQAALSEEGRAPEPPLARGDKARVVAVAGMTVIVERPREETEHGAAVFAEDEMV